MHIELFPGGFATMKINSRVNYQFSRDNRTVSAEAPRAKVGKNVLLARAKVSKGEPFDPVYYTNILRDIVKKSIIIQSEARRQ